MLSKKVYLVKKNLFSIFRIDFRLLPPCVSAFCGPQETEIQASAEEFGKRLKENGWNGQSPKQQQQQTFVCQKKLSIMWWTNKKWKSKDYKSKEK